MNFHLGVLKPAFQSKTTQHRLICNPTAGLSLFVNAKNDFTMYLVTHSNLNNIQACPVNCNV